MLGDSAAVAPLVEALKDEDAGLRQVCAQALDKLHYQPEKAEDNVTYLIALQAWDQVAKMGAPAFEPLHACLSDQNTDVKQGAIGALGNLGDKRAISSPSEALLDWNLNGALVSALEQLGWKPTSDAEQIYEWIGNKDSAHLKEQWEKTRQVLLNDVSSSNHQKMENAVYSFMAIGDPKVVDDLVKALAEQGDKDMAETFLNSGNDKLEQAARDWASSNGYQTIMLPAGSTPMPLGVVVRGCPPSPLAWLGGFNGVAIFALRAKIKSGQAFHGTGRTSLPLLPSGPGGVHAPAHAWRLAKVKSGRFGTRFNLYFEHPSPRNVGRGLSPTCRS